MSAAPSDSGDDSDLAAVARQLLLSKDGAITDSPTYGRLKLAPLQVFRLAAFCVKLSLESYEMKPVVTFFNENFEEPDREIKEFDSSYPRDYVIKSLTGLLMVDESIVRTLPGYSLERRVEFGKKVINLSSNPLNLWNLFWEYEMDLFNPGE